jgi:prepilin-type N-terminal cleavage/methylation domain
MRARRVGGNGDKRGYSLIEVMIALLLSVAGFVPILSLLTMSQQVGQQAQIQAVAYNVARQQMEQLRALDHSNRPLTAEKAFPIPDDATAALPLRASAVTMTGTYAITATTSGTLRQIDVVVRWKSAVRGSGSAAQSPTSEVRLTTLVAQMPPF